jgi:hypothetical protein
MNQSVLTFAGDAAIPPHASMTEFWRWAFSDLCDDDIKGIFAEWMVGNLLGLPLDKTRRVSWADSDLFLPSGKGIEVKASAVWQSWKLVNPDGTAKPAQAVTIINPKRIRFAGLQARTAVSPAPSGQVRRFKSDYYIFCMHTQTDPSSWDAWNLAYWQFFLLSKQELISADIGQSISLARLCELQAPMSTTQFQTYAKQVLGSEMTANPKLINYGG